MRCLLGLQQVERQQLDRRCIRPSAVHAHAPPILEEHVCTLLFGRAGLFGQAVLQFEHQDAHVALAHTLDAVSIDCLPDRDLR